MYTRITQIYQDAYVGKHAQYTSITRYIRVPFDFSRNAVLVFTSCDIRQLPLSFEVNGKTLMKGLLTRQPRKRLGSGLGGWEVPQLQRD